MILQIKCNKFARDILLLKVTVLEIFRYEFRKTLIFVEFRRFNKSNVILSIQEPLFVSVVSFLLRPACFLASFSSADPLASDTMYLFVLNFLIIFSSDHELTTVFFHCDYNQDQQTALLF